MNEGQMKRYIMLYQMIIGAILSAEPLINTNTVDRHGSLPLSLVLSGLKGLEGLCRSRL
jgi:hypothetical protein